MQQHVGLVLKAFPFNLAKSLQILAGNGPQASLRIREFNTIAKAKQAGSGLVPRHAPGRDAGLIKVPAAQNHLVTQGQHFLPAGDNIRQKMLAVTVDRDDTLYIRQLLQHIAKGSLQSRALAPVHRVNRDMALLVGGGSFKKMLVPGIASVVYNHNIFKAALEKPIHNGGEFFIRIEGRKNDGQFLLALFIGRH